MKTYLITGGAGFIGSNLAKKLLNNGNKVLIIDNLFTGFERNIPERAIFYKIDLSNDKELDKININDHIDVIYHLAAQSSGEASFDDPLRDIDFNYKATYNILNFARKNNVQRFIFSSSMSVYGEVQDENIKASENFMCEPVSYYGCNKYASEKLIKIFANNYDLNYTIFRLFNVYGPGQNMFNLKQGMVSIYLSYLINEEPIVVKGSLNRFRDFVYIDDVLGAFIECENNSRSFGKILNLATGIKTDIRSLLVLLLKIFDKKPFENWIKISENTQGDVKGLVADISEVKNILKWNPTYDIEKGLTEMKIWLDETKSIWRNN